MHRVGNQRKSFRLTFEKLEPRLPLAAPQGTFDGIKPDFSASGWSFDPDATSQSLLVQFRIDDNFVEEQQTSVLRTDVNELFGIEIDGVHGFRWEIPDAYLDGNSYSLSVIANDFPGSNFVEIANSPQSFTNTLPQGFVDGVTSNFAIGGWAFDADVPNNAIEVAFFVDGVFIESRATDLLRADVNDLFNITGDHGFLWPIPGAFLDGQPHTVRVAARDPARDSGDFFLGPEIPFINQVPVGQVVASNQVPRVLEGWAYDPDTPDEPLTIRIFNEEGSFVSTVANLASPPVSDGSGVTGNQGWKIVLPESFVRDGQPHSVDIFAVDSSRVLETNLPPTTLIGTETVQQSQPGNIPARHSNPGAPANIFLDFDGNFEATWNEFSDISTPVFDLDGNPSFLSEDEKDFIELVYQAVSEDFSPFDVNVTTVDPGDFSNQVGLKVSIGGDGTWFGQLSPGAAKIGSFTNSRPNVTFVFPDAFPDLLVTAPSASKDDPRLIADAISQGVGSAFGLFPQSVYDNGNLVEAYNNGVPEDMEDGDGNGFPEVAPLMGEPYRASRSTWTTGPTILSSNSIQDDLKVIADPLVGPDNGFGFRIDDHGNDINSATPLQPLPVDGPSSQLHYIEQPDDIDVFSVTLSIGGEVGIDIVTLEPGISNLDLSISLLDSVGAPVPITPTQDRSVYSLRATLDPGNYFLVIGGTGEAGSVGAYFFNIDDILEIQLHLLFRNLTRMEVLPPDLPLSPSPENPLSDFNSDSIIDNFDLTLWLAGFGTTQGSLPYNGDSDADGDTDGADFLAWQRDFTPAANQQAVVSSLAMPPTLETAGKPPIANINPAEIAVFSNFGFQPRIRTIDRVFSQMSEEVQAIEVIEKIFADTADVSYQALIPVGLRADHASITEREIIFERYTNSIRTDLGEELGTFLDSWL